MSKRAVVQAENTQQAQSDLSRRRLLAGIGAVGAIGGLAGLIPGAGVGVAEAAGCNDGFVSVKDYGAVGDGSTDDSTAIQNAIDDTAGDGRAVMIPGGVYMIGTPLQLRSRLTLRGIGRGATILRLAPNSLGPILEEPQSGGISQTVDDLVLTDLTLDGDAANSTVSGSASNPLLRTFQSHRWHIARCRIMNSRGIGVGLMGDPRSSTPGKQGPHEDTHVLDCQFSSNGTVGTGDGFRAISAERLTLEQCTGIENSNRAIAIRARFATLVGCHSVDDHWGIVVDTIPNLAGSSDDDTYVAILGGSAERSAGPGLSITNYVNQSEYEGITHATVAGFNSRNNAWGLGGTGITAPATDEAISLAIMGGQYTHNSNEGIDINGFRDLTVQGVVARQNGKNGIKVRDVSYASIAGCQLRTNGEWGVLLTGSLTDRIATHGNIFKDNKSGTLSNSGRHSKAAVNISDEAGTVASASTINLPTCEELVLVTGTTDISSIGGSFDGRTVTLLFADALTVTKGANLHLASDFGATADDTLTLVCHESEWYEHARSVNT